MFKIIGKPVNLQVGEPAYSCYCENEMLNKTAVI